MGSAESDAFEKATRDDGSFDESVYQAEYARILRERQDLIVQQSHEVWRAMEGWRGVENPEAWDTIVREAAKELASGFFLIDRMGGERYIDPKMMAVLKIIRDGLIREYEVDSTTDLMLIDMMLMQYHHVITTNTWVGNLVAATQTEFFGPASLTSKLEGQYGRGAEFRGLRVEEFIRRLSEQPMPLIERSNRLLLRNLKALQDRKNARAPRSVARRTDQSPRGAEPVDDAFDDRPVQGPLPIRKSARS